MWVHNTKTPCLAKMPSRTKALILYVVWGANQVPIVSLLLQLVHHMWKLGLAILLPGGQPMFKEIKHLMIWGF